VKAGGGTQFADIRRVKLTRKMKDGTSKTYIIDVKAVLEDGKMDKDMQLQDGDYIFVPRRLITF
jgi:polysaccharide biosynthesis/export protein